MDEMAVDLHRRSSIPVPVLPALPEKGRTPFMTMTEANLEAIEARANAATAAPWCTGSIPWQVWYDGGNGKICRIESKGEDREFIANARQDVPALIGEIRRLRHIISEKPDNTPYVKGEAAERFQRFWEALVGLSDKADFKYLVQHIKRLEDELHERRLKDKPGEGK